MKYKGSIIASEIISDWNYERYLKRLYETRKRLLQKDNNKEVVNESKIQNERDIQFRLNRY